MKGEGKANLIPYNERELSGRRIVLTRSQGQNEELGHKLEALGAEVFELPLIEVQTENNTDIASEILTEIGHYEWLVFTSANGVRGFFNLFLRAFEDIRSLGMVRIAAVGPGTAEAIRLYHLKVDLIPATATADALVEAIEKEQTVDNLRFLVITGNLNKDTLIRRLEEGRAIVDVLPVYQTETATVKDDAALRFRRQGADAIVFASGSAVQSFALQAASLQLEAGARHPLVFSIGPSTTQAIRQAGIPLAAEASEPGIDGLLKAIVARLGAGQ